MLLRTSNVGGIKVGTMWLVEKRGGEWELKTSLAGDYLVELGFWYVVILTREGRSALGIPVKEKAGFMMG